jgi:ribonuclease III
MDYHPLQTALGYQFKNRALLQEALRHSSFVNEQNQPGLRDNERYEFLGDAVLNLIVGHLMMQAYPDMREGDLSIIRANMVNETQLAQIARTIDLGPWLQLGKGELLGQGYEKNSILANALEAVIAAIYLDDGFETALRILQHHFKHLVDEAKEICVGIDHKSRLQELVQGTLRATPEYRILEEIGPDHDKTFRVLVCAGNIEAEGVGKSKKMAEQEAARNGLELIEKQTPSTN